jgi:hypothetical protein
MEITLPWDGAEAGVATVDTRETAPGGIRPAPFGSAPRTSGG